MWEKDDPKFNKDKNGECFRGSTDNDYLSIIEAKHYRYNKDKMLLEDLGARVKKVLLNPALDPDDEVTQQDLETLLHKGVIDQNQAFLVYHLMHKQRIAHKKNILTIDNDLYIFFGQLPVCYTLNILFLLLVAILLITHVFKKTEN